jgi:hypothetical protein
MVHIDAFPPARRQAGSERIRRVERGHLYTATSNDLVSRAMRVSGPVAVWPVAPAGTHVARHLANAVASVPGGRTFCRCRPCNALDIAFKAALVGWADWPGVHLSPCTRKRRKVEMLAPQRFAELAVVFGSRSPRRGTCRCHLP